LTIGDFIESSVVEIILGALHNLHYFIIFHLQHFASIFGDNAIRTFTYIGNAEQVKVKFYAQDEGRHKIRGKYCNVLGLHMLPHFSERQSDIYSSEQKALLLIHPKPL
jgi:hypothetical protein